MKIEIKCRFSGSVLFSHDAEKNTVKITIEAAITARANLAGANLDGANLDGANLARAYLDGAYLDGANLARANLACANLDGEILTEAPISISNLIWPILITKGYMRIGCQRHTHEEWATFDDDNIASMESRAHEFWVKWKASLLAMCEAMRGEA